MKHTFPEIILYKNFNRLNLSGAIVMVDRDYFTVETLWVLMYVLRTVTQPVSFGYTF